MGDGNQSLSFGAQGTTTIDGGKITTGQISAQRLDVGSINVTQTNNYNTIQQNIQSAEQAGVTAGQQAAAQAVQAQQGVSTAQQGVTAAQQGVTAAQQAAAAAVQTLPTQTSQLTNNSNFQTSAFTSAGQVNITQTQNYAAPPTQTGQLQNNSGFQTAAIVFSATAISGGKIGLSTAGLVIGSSGHSISASNSIILDTTSGNNAISIYDGSTLRVKIGKL